MIQYHHAKHCDTMIYQFLSTTSLLEKCCEAHAKYFWTLRAEQQIYLSADLRQTAGGAGAEYWLLGKDIPAVNMVSVLMGDEYKLSRKLGCLCATSCKEMQCPSPSIIFIGLCTVTLYCWLSKPTVNERWWTWKWSEPHMDKVHIWVTARTSDSEPAGLTIIQVDNSGDFNRLGCFFTEERKLYFSDNWLWPLLKDTVVLRLSGNQLLFSWNQSLGSFW